MINAGVGESQITTILETLNIIPPSSKTLKSREREIGPAIEEAAEDSCNQVVEDEIKTALNM